MSNFFTRVPFISYIEIKGSKSYGSIKIIDINSKNILVRALSGSRLFLEDKIVFKIDNKIDIFARVQNKINLMFLLEYDISSDNSLALQDLFIRNIGNLDTFFLPLEYDKYG